MQTKLTLRIESSLISAAKKYSKTHGKSLSKLFADYLLLITSYPFNEKQQLDIPPITQSLNGILRGKKINEKDYKKYLKDKYQ
jgi:hypothetical protein